MINKQSNKSTTMKKFFSLFAAALMSFSAMAATITMDGSEFTGGTVNTGSEVTLTKGDVTVSTDKGYAAGDHLRVYANGVLSFTASSKISKIEFTWATNNKYEGPTTETPNATSYSINAAKQMRIAKIVITTDGEGGGDNPGGDNPGGGTTGGNTVAINNNFLYVDAYNFDDEDGKGWSFDFYSNFDEETYEVYGEELYFHFFSTKTASINGTYPVEYGYYYKDDADEEGVEFTSGTVTIAAKGTKDEYDDPIYQFTATLQGADGNTYTLNKSFGIYATNDDGDITLNENGGGDNPGPGPEPTGTITVAEALAIGEKLADNASTTEVYTVVGYVGKAYEFNTQYNNQTWFMTDDKDFDPTTRFDFEAYQCTVDKAVVAGDYVALTGNILKYVNNNSGNVTIEIKKGDAKHVIPSAINNVENVVRPIKTIENGRLIIRRADKTYNVMGQNF